MEVDAQRVADGIAADWYAEQAWLAKQRQPAPPARCVPPGRSSEELHEALRAIPADIWLPALTGVDVPRSRTVCCPLPGHEDRSPSCRFYDTSFFCFGCHAGGDIFAFASALFGIPSHGPSFPELRERLADHLLGVAV